MKDLKYICILFEFKHTEFFTSHRGYLLNTTLWVLGVGFLVPGLDRANFGFYWSQSFLFIVVMVILILMKTTFWQTSIHSQSVVKSF